MSPAPIPKANVIVDQRLRDDARGEDCVRCSINDGTTVSAHYTGFRQLQYGKGKSVKGHDLITAWLCHTCHTHFDQPETRKSIDASEEFLHLVMLTNVLRYQKGLLITAKRVKQGIYECQ